MADRSADAPTGLGVARAAGGRQALSRKLAPFVASAGLVVVVLALTDLKTEGTAAYRDPGWDRHLYVYMAGTNPFDFHLAPFAWRILVPALAWASPLPLQTTFLAVAVAAAVGTGGVLYCLWRAMGLSPGIAAAGLLFYASLGWGMRYQLADFWIPDAAAFFAVAVAILMAARARPVAFAMALAAGVLAKESVILVAPLYYTLNAARFVDRRLALRAAAVTVPAMVTIIALRLAIPSWNADAAYIATLPGHISSFPELYPEYNYPSLLRTIGYEQRLQDLGVDTLETFTIGTYGLPVLALAAVGLRWNGLLALRLAAFLALVYAQLLFATDTERLLVLGAPALAWLALVGAKELCSRTPLHTWHLVLLGAMSLALLLGDRERFAVDILPQLALAAAWVAIVVASAKGRAWLRASRSSPPGGPANV